MRHLPERDRPPILVRMHRAWAETDPDRALEQLQRLASELDPAHPGAASSLREGMEETLTVTRLRIKGKLKRTLESTNPCESMIDCVRTTQRNVKHWSSGEMGMRWTAAGMLEAEKQFRKVVGYTQLPHLAIAIERRLTFTSPTATPTRRRRSQSLCNDHTRTVVTEVPRRTGQPPTAPALPSESENADLFWAVRGGGKNFGVVTSFSFGLHPVDTVSGGVTLWPIEQGPEVLRWYREFLPQAPEDLYGFFAFLVVPPGPPFPEEIHLKNMCGIVWCYAGDPQTRDEVFAPVRQVGSLTFAFVEPMPYPALQTMFDELIPKGLQWYWRGDFFDQITDEAIDVHMKYGSNLPTMLSTMHLYPIDGAPQRVSKDATAWGYRDAVWSGVIVGSISTRPTPRRSGSGVWAIGRSCTRSRWARRT